MTLTVSRGLDHGDSVEVPDVSGFTTDEAVTRLGKWLDVQVVEEQNTEVEELDHVVSHRVLKLVPG